VLSNLCLRQGWFLFTIRAIASAESNTPAIEQTAFLSLKPPRKLFGMAVFVVLARIATNTQTLKLAGVEKPGFSAIGEKFQLCLVGDSMNRSIFGILETSTQLS